MHVLRKALHWMLDHPAHQHHYSLHVERDALGNVKLYWKCLFALCDDEIEVTEWD